jgi:hypothetical protein
MRKRVEAFFWRVWIEDNLDEPKKTIVFDDEFEAGGRLHELTLRSYVLSLWERIEVRATERSPLTLALSRKRARE